MTAHPGMRAGMAVGRSYNAQLHSRTISFFSRFMIFFFQPGNIGLGNTQICRDLLLGHFLPVRRIQSKTQADDCALPLESFATAFLKILRSASFSISR